MTRRGLTSFSLLQAGGFCLAVMLAGCGTTQHTSTPHTATIDARLEQAAADAQRQGRTQDSLAYLEKLYRGNSDNPDAALKYTAALRDAGFYNRALAVIEPFGTRHATDNPLVMVEYATLLTEMGNYKAAEDAARKAVTLDDTSGRAYHLLGIALDAQGHHPQAKIAFEKALEHWEGDPSPVLNNMGLNMASLGFIDDAIDTLRRALATAPNRSEIERNLRIISALRYEPSLDGTGIPMPGAKPAGE